MTPLDIYVGAPYVTQSDRGMENFNVADPTHTPATSSIPHFLALSNTNGFMDTRTSNQDRCGRDSVGCGPLAS